MFQIGLIFVPISISTHMQPRQPPLLVAQVGLGVCCLLVFSLKASWQQSWPFRSLDISGWAGGCALSTG